MGIALALAIAVTAGTAAAGPANAAPAPISVESAVNIAAAKVNMKMVTTNNLNLRQGASTGTRSLIVMPKNTKLTITETKGKWYKTSYKGKTGWTSSLYLKKAPAPKPASKPAAKPTPKPAAKPATKVTYRWTSANVNIRKGSGTNHGSLGVVKANERVTYIKTSNGWSNVKSSKGTGWISNKYLSNSGQHSFAVYGTLRNGQSAYHLLRGKTTKETKTKIASFNMYLKPAQTWWSYIVSTNSSSRTVVVERMDIKPAEYAGTVARMDSWERYNPNAPLADQGYNRKLVKDIQGHTSWAYVGGSKISSYLAKNGIRVASGDYLKRF